MFGIHLIAADVKILIREESGHFAQDPFQEVVKFGTRGVHDRGGNSPGTQNLNRAGCRSELGIGGEPALGVPRYVELRHYADAAVTGVFDNSADFPLGVEKAVRAELVKPGRDIRFHAEALIVGQVPVEDVELYRGHTVEITADDVEGHEVAGGVEQKSAPREAGLIGDANGRHGPAGFVAGDELEKGLHGVQGAQGVGSGCDRLAGVDCELIAFVLGKRLYSIAGGSGANHQRGLRGGGCARNRN